MFKKLKEKITEEVKSSPQRIQQFTQSVSDRLQNSTTSDENFFSIGGEDAEAANSSVASGTDPGFSNVPLMASSPQESRLRRTSTSSMASDVSFLPRYESIANMYHLQSDLDISASELEDNASSTSSQLGHLSKEQIYSAFQKSQMRYHKYRGRYTDLARHYKDLEREIAKMKSVLVETQDKAIRRVTELKEQCALEQKAKAHLESALRDELDEREFKIQTLETKIRLLQNTNGSEGDPNVAFPQQQQNGGDLESLTKYLNEARVEIENLNAKLQETKANSIVFQSKEADLKSRIAALEKEVVGFGEREKENNLRLGQTKMELHNELLSKEAELANYKQDNDVLRQSLEAFETNKLENLQSQNRKLIEKLESQTMKIQSHERDLIKLEQDRIEIENLKEINSKLTSDLRLIEDERNEIESKLTQVREDTKKSLLSLEDKIRTEVRLEFVARENLLKEEITKSGDFGENDRLELVENRSKIDDFCQKINALESESIIHRDKYKNLEENYLRLLAENNDLKTDKELELKYQRLEEEYADLDSFTKELQSKVRLFEEKDYALNLDKTEAKLLEAKLQKLEEENVSILESFENERIVFENMIADKSKLVEISETKIKNLEDELTAIKKELENLQNNSQLLEIELNELSQEKIELDRRNRDLEERCRIYEEKDYALNLDKTEAKLLEAKLQKMEEEKVSISESFENERAVFETLLADKSKLEESEKKVVNLEDALKSVQKELGTLQDNSRLLETELHEINQEKIELDERNRNLEERVRIFEEKDYALNLDKTEAKLLEAKLQKLEEERISLLESFENERRVFESIQNDNSQLKEAQTRLKISEERLKELESELDHLKDNYDKQNYEFRALEGEKSDLENLVTVYSEKVRIYEEKNEAIELEQTECRLLEMKLQKLEEEKNNLMETFEKEEILQESNLEEKSREVGALKAELATLTDRLNAKIADFDSSNAKLAESADLVRSLRDQAEHSRGEFELQTSFYDDERSKFLRENQELVGQLEDLSNLLKIKEIAVEKYENFLGKITNNHQSLDLDSELSKILGLLNNLETIEKEKSKLEEKIHELMENQTKILEENSKLINSVEELEKRISQINSDNQFLTDENNNLTSQLEEVKLRLETVTNDLKQENGNHDDGFKEKFDELLFDNEKLRQENVKLNKDNAQLSEYEKHLNELQHEKQLLRDEIEELKTSPVNVTATHENHDVIGEKYSKEIDSLRDKLAQYKSLDLTNRTSIEFYESELEKFKNQNEKLNRKLDETLVTLGHCTELSSGSTEIEYLRNVLYNYMLGKESLVLARVIAAVCKFDQQQTETVLAKEQQKQTLLGQLGIL